jgi:glycosyltransferase involved in cell wall biosynthesis
MGLWATITSCEDDLLRAGFDYNYVIVCNGDEKLEPDTQNTIHNLKEAGKVLKLIHSPDPVAPPLARQMGADAADGKYIFFFDNHCIISRDYFKRAMMDFEKYDIDLLHSTTRYFARSVTHYEYKLKLACNFWAEATVLPQVPMKPYRCGVGGHGGFAVKSESWRSVGGYGPSDLFKGYGGEEVYLDLKMWMLGKSVWIDPLVIHYHYAGDRGYKRHYSDEFYINMMVCANVIGGREWLYTVYESFSQKGKFVRYKSDKSMYDLLMVAEAHSAPHAAEMASVRQKSLDELLQWFIDNDIPA